MIALTFSAMCRALSIDKGYNSKGHGFLGFFFGVFGLLYMIGLSLATQSIVEQDEDVKRKALKKQKKLERKQNKD